MGCSTSRQRRDEESDDDDAHISQPPPINRNKPGQQPPLVRTRFIPVSSLDAVIPFAYHTQRGFYPRQDKDNQDDFCVIPSFAGDPDATFFGVFDGHGTYGNECSAFARHRIPELLALDPLLTTDFEAAYRNAFIETNREMHGKIDDENAGTTAICVLLHGRSIYCANVGDSRAMIAVRQDDGSIATEPLSLDQTPFREDEVKRCIRAGAVIMSIGQMLGEVDRTDTWSVEEFQDDPPRLWTKNSNSVKMAPGCAFTRSIGDISGEVLGCIPEPEILVRVLQPKDEFIVIGSDGIFEFFSSDQIAQMMEEVGIDDPLACAQHVIEESFHEWLRKDTRTDDLTCIVVDVRGLGTGFPMEGKRVEQPFEKLHMVESVKTRFLMTADMCGAQPCALSLLDMCGAAPGKAWGENTATLREKGAGNEAVRKKISQERREQLNMIRAQSAKDHGKRQAARDPHSHQGAHPVFEKDDVERKEITKAVNQLVVFGALSNEHKQTVIDAIEVIKVDAGVDVITQGEMGLFFYILGSGSLDVIIENRIVHGYEVNKNVHPSFGELSLLFDTPRAATVRAKTESILWRLDYKTFQDMVDENEAQYEFVHPPTKGGQEKLKQQKKTKVRRGSFQGQGSDQVAPAGGP